MEYSFLFHYNTLGDIMNKYLYEQCTALIDESLPSISNISNLIALLFHEMKHINWLGFYLFNENTKECVLGPFQGKVACTKISYGKGVVGTCASSLQTQRIDNVHTFPGHIACDSASNSELCIPIKKDDKLLAILDIDSIEFNNFSQTDQEQLEKIANLFVPLFG